MIRKFWRYYHHNYRMAVNSYKNYYINKLKYTRVAHPFKPIQIDPHNIEYRITGRTSKEGLAQIQGGDWDRAKNLDRVDNKHIVSGLKQHFVYSTPWEETDYVEALHKKYSNYDNKEGIIRKKIKSVEILYENINRDGYLSPNKLDRSCGVDCW